MYSEFQTKKSRLSKFFIETTGLIFGFALALLWVLFSFVLIQSRPFNLLDYFVETALLYAVYVSTIAAFRRYGFNRGYKNFDYLATESAHKEKVKETYGLNEELQAYCTKLYFDELKDKRMSYCAILGRPYDYFFDGITLRLGIKDQYLLERQAEGVNVSKKELKRSINAARRLLNRLEKLDVDRFTPTLLKDVDHCKEGHNLDSPRIWESQDEYEKRDSFKTLIQKFVWAAIFSFFVVNIKDVSWVSVVQKAFESIVVLISAAIAMERAHFFITHTQRKRIITRMQVLSDFLQTLKKEQ
jgi:hypothetical protein